MIRIDSNLSAWFVERLLARNTLGRFTEVINKKRYAYISIDTCWAFEQLLRYIVAYQICHVEYKTRSSHEMSMPNNSEVLAEGTPLMDARKNLANHEY